MDPAQWEAACCCFDPQVTSFDPAAFINVISKPPLAFSSKVMSKKPSSSSLPWPYSHRCAQSGSISPSPMCLLGQKREKYFISLLVCDCLNTFVNMTAYKCCRSVKPACRQHTQC